jgi:acetyl-CoA carboxylase carboxyltransferase component
VPEAEDAQEITLVAPFAGSVAQVAAVAGAAVQAGDPVVVLEAMKMEHEIVAERAGTITRVLVAEGDAVTEGAPLAVIAPAGTERPGAPDAPEASAAVPGPDSPAVEAAVDASAPGPPTDDDDALADDDSVRADLQAVHARHALTRDAARPDAVQARHSRGRRTARENLEDLLDPGSFVEYGPLVYAAQERRRPRQELIERTPADGLVAGVGTVDGRPTMALSYDYTVLAGTQGWRNHAKKDRLFELARERELPVVLFAEGGGGRPGDVDLPVIAGLDTRAFELFARLSGNVPLVGIATGFTFAGNAALLGCCDVVIATEDACIGMGGPAMIGGGGLGHFAPEEIGPIDVQWANGVVDVRVADDAQAVAAARAYLGYVGWPAAGDTTGDPAATGGQDATSAAGTAPDQTRLRDLIPTNRKRVYEIRTVIETLADEHLELRRGFAAGMVTALARIGGRPLGIIANDPTHLGGAIDADGADKAARFMQLCDAHGLPLLFLADTPGFMVGPDAERTATVRHVSRMFVTAANLSVAVGTVVLRKGYGLGAQAMAGGSFKAGRFCVAWPTGEFGGMGLEGAVRLGMRRELEAIADPREREATYEQMVADAYERGSAINMAAHFELDDVIDPADTRRWVAQLFDPGHSPEPTGRHPRRARPQIDTW